MNSTNDQSNICDTLVKKKQISQLFSVDNENMDEDEMECSELKRKKLFKQMHFPTFRCESEQFVSKVDKEAEESDRTVEEINVDHPLGILFNFNSQFPDKADLPRGKSIVDEEDEASPRVRIWKVLPISARSARQTPKIQSFVKPEVKLFSLSPRSSTLNGILEIKPCGKIRRLLKRRILAEARLKKKSSFSNISRSDFQDFVEVSLTKQWKKSMRISDKDEKESIDCSLEKLYKIRNKY